MKNQIKKLALCVTLLSVVLLVSGCQGTMHGMSQDANRNSDAVARTVNGY